MKTIYQNLDHQAATKLLGQLTQAHADATAQATALLTQLDTQHESEKPSAVDRAKAMLTGKAPAQRQDTAGLSAQLSVVRELLIVLGEAIAEQRQELRDLVSAHGAVVNADRKADHLKSAQRLQNALVGLAESLDADQQLRAEIEAAGYVCTSEPMAHPELNFNDTESTVTRFKKHVDDYLLLNEIASAKSVNIRMLAGETVGDVLTVSGAEAAACLRSGRCELTTAKVGRATKPDGAVRGLSMANAHGA
jgi:hypothetical protein